MSKRKRGSNKRTPRMSGPASDCLVIRDGEVVGSFTPKPRLPKRLSIVEAIDGSGLIVQISDLR